MKIMRGSFVVCLSVLLYHCLCPLVALAKPRGPLPPWPEVPLQHWSFDAAYWASLNESESLAAGFSDLAEGWSGFALQRDGWSTSPIIMPGVDANGHTNIATAQGAIRFWFAPAWSSVSLGGKGPENYARLVELVVANGNSLTVAWSLYVSPDGSTLFLSGQGAQGPTDFLKADVQFETGRWYLLTLNYGPNGTALYVNTGLVAEGTGLPAVNSASAGLVVGSDGTGANLAGGLFDEVTTFGQPATPADQAAYYNGVSGQAALGPISAAEEEAALKAAEAWQAEQEAGMMRFAWSEPAAECVTNVPVYLTNIVSALDANNGWTVSFTIEGGTNGVPYDIFTSTNLAGDSISHTNCLWELLDQGYTCTTYTFTNQPAAYAFYVLGVTNDLDADGLSDAFELLVSKTLITTNDTDADGLPDGWEVHHGLKPKDSSDASDDPDGDWVTNLQEYNGGTNSTEPNDTMVVAWGNNINGQCNVPADLRNVMSLAGGDYHSLALQSNGTVVAWGGNSDGQTTVPTGLTNAAAIAAGPFHSLALRSDGTVIAWGGYLHGTSNSVYVPVGLSNVTAIAAGADHDLAVKADGTVTAWGYYDQSAPFNNVPTNLISVRAVAAGDGHSIALLSNGTVVAWGIASYGVTNVPAGLSNVTAIAMGAYHVLALKTNGTVTAWGAGQTNGGYSYDKGQSIVPTGLSNVIAVAAAGYNSAALRADGTLVLWGDNFFGQTNGLPGVSNLVAIGLGVQHDLAVRSGRLTPLITKQPTDQFAPVGSSATFTSQGLGLAGVHYQWQLNGVNITGATNASLTLSNVSTNDEGNYQVIISTGAGSVTSSVATLTLVGPPQILSATPMPPSILWVPIFTNLNVAATAAGQSIYPISYQWKSNGTNIPSATGPNYLFNNLSPEGDYTVTIANAAGATNVGTWNVHILQAGMVAAWGANGDAECDRPVALTNSIALAAGEFHSVAVRDDGSVTQWGYPWASIPTNLTNAVSVSAGYDHTLALRNDGTVISWGDTNSVANVQTNLTGVKAIAAGWNHNLALLTNKTVTAWGVNGAELGWHLLEVPGDLTNATAIAAGALHSLALRENGTVSAWGYNDQGQTNVPSGLTNVVGIAAGGSHSLALKSDGTVVGWGLNSSGQTNVPAGLSNVMAIAAGFAHSVALKNDGTVVAWGNNSDGQTDVPTTLFNIKLIAAGGDHTLATRFSPLVQYSVDVTQDLLLIYNTNSINSIVVKDYYLAHRPMVSGANVVGIGSVTAERIDLATYTNQIVPPIKQWLSANPTKRPQYMILFPDIPSRIWLATNGCICRVNSTAYELSTIAGGIPSFVNSINMGLCFGTEPCPALTNDCIAYINKLEFFGTNYSPRKLFISASSGGYGNANYVVDDVRHSAYGGGIFDGPTVSVATNGLTSAGVSPSAVFYLNDYEYYTGSNYLARPHLTNAVNVAGYICWGAHSTLDNEYSINGVVKWSGSSAWWIIETIESFNGQRNGGMGDFTQWFSPNAFGGTNYANTPVGAVSHTDEPSLSGANDARIYFGLWAGGKNFAVSAWNSRATGYFQAVGDPFITK